MQTVKQISCGPSPPRIHLLLASGPSSSERNVIHQNLSRCARTSTPRHRHSRAITRGHRTYYTQQHTYSYPRHTCRFNKTAPILMASLTSRLYISCGKRGGLWLLGGRTSMYTVQMECLPEKGEQRLMTSATPKL